MSRDCKRLSPAAREIFKKLEPFFPPDPWKKPLWVKSGRVYSNGWHDLKLAADRKKLLESNKSFMGYCIQGKASSFRDKHGSLEGFADEPISKMVAHNALLQLLLEDLDFQIETMDLVEA
jgi:hypothetical protein